jgi:hypothetical protein
VTHPFHPLHGRECVVVAQRLNGGEDRVYYLDETGKLCGIPTRWTSLWTPDPEVSMGAGRSAFRATDLAQLASLVKELLETHEAPSSRRLQDV